MMAGGANGWVIRPYQPADETAILEIWNAALTHDPISPATWRSRVLLDPNFQPEGCPVAVVDGQPRGFLLSLTRQVPFFTDGLQPDQAWITAFAVHPAWQGQGLGSALLQTALDRLRRQGVRTVTIATYLPHYFFPGVDVEAYAPGLAFLTRRGFTVIARPLSMQADLTGFQIPPAIAAVADRLRAEGVTVRPVEPTDILPLLTFLRQHFSWDWHREACEVLRDLFAGDPRAVGLLVALQNDTVVGYAQHRGERFGPFGVHPEHRRRGIGRVLLALTLRAMLAKGYHTAWFLWTSDQAARLYATCGFRAARRFAVLRLLLTP